MKSLITAAFVLALAGAAQALPVAPLPGDGLTTHVAQGCGPGFARNAAGRCRPAYMARPCPRGMHRSVMGNCRPNR